MKKLLILAVFLIAGFAFNTNAKTFYSDYGFFYAQLSPHGSWIELNSGIVVWRPINMSRNWAPYRYGQWVWTNHGWYWDSYEPFGYIVYHYGRWHYDNYYGWIWVPDNEWAPAWVEWRYDDNYIGWAPLPPYAAFSIHIGIHFTYEYHTPYKHWHFVKYNYLCDPYVYRYYVGAQNKYKVYSKTKYRTNYGYENGRVYNRGVDIDYVKTRSRRDIKLRQIETVRNVNELSVERKISERNTDRVRTYIPTREEISKVRSNDVKIQRSERTTSLDASKVVVGRNRDAVRKNNGNVRENNSPVIRGNEKINSDVKEDKTFERQRESDRVLRENDRYKREVPVKENPVIEKQKTQQRVIERRENAERNNEVKQEKNVEKRNAPQVRTERKERTVERPVSNNRTEVKREERKVNPGNNNSQGRERNTGNSRSTERRR